MITRFPKLPAAVLILATLAAAIEHTKPVARFRIEPEYTKEARKARIEGLVVLTFTVGKDGIPKDIVVARSLDKGLDQKAIEALRRWIFRPATVDGEAVEFRSDVDVTFNLGR